MAGRPTIFTQEIADTICERMAGGESVRSICSEDGLPSRRTVTNWKNSNAEFAAQYARAQGDQVDLFVDDIIAISDDGTNDYVNRDGRPMVDYDHIARSKLRVESRRWLLERLRPAIFGNKVQHANAAGDGNASMKVVVELVGDAAPVIEHAPQRVNGPRLVSDVDWKG